MHVRVKRRKEKIKVHGIVPQAECLLSWKDVDQSSDVSHSGSPVLKSLSVR